MAELSQIEVNSTTYDLKDVTARQVIPWCVIGSTSTSTAYVATVTGVTKLANGVSFICMNNKVTSAENCTLNVNSLGAKPIYMTNAAATRVTTQFAKDVTWMFTYNESRVSGGCWDLIYLYNTNSTYAGYSFGLGYGECTTAAATVAKACTISSYALHNGGVVSIKFTNDVCANATLNIRTRGAKPIYYRGAAIVDGIIKGGDTATFQYYSNVYYLLCIDRWGRDISTVGTAVVGLSDVLADYVTPSSMTPLMDGIADVGTSVDYARADHVHPSDESRAPLFHADPAGTYGIANEYDFGHVRLSDFPDSNSGTSTGYAATPYALYQVSSQLPQYYYCNSAGNSAGKEISVDFDWSEVPVGKMITVYFANRNTAASPYFCTNGFYNSNYCYICYGTYRLDANNAGVLYGLVTFAFNGSGWSIINNNGELTKIGFYTCTTSANVAAKQCGSDTREPAAGTRITVKFNYANTANSPQIKTFSTAYNVFHNGAQITTGSNKGLLAGICDFIFDGTQWHLIGNYINTTYTNTSFGQGYGTCATGSNTETKDVTLSNYELITGGIIAVKFTNQVYTGGSHRPKLNVNSKGAKDIYYKGALITYEYGDVIKAGDVATFMYDGSVYHLLSVDESSDTRSMIALIADIIGGDTLGTTATTIIGAINEILENSNACGCAYGTCATAQATSPKLVTSDGFKLSTGGIINVKFTNAVNANHTMNVNSTGAKTIKCRGENITGGMIAAGDIATFVYDGTNYNLISTDRVALAPLANGVNF